MTQTMDEIRAIPDQTKVTVTIKSRGMVSEALPAIRKTSLDNFGGDGTAGFSLKGGRALRISHDFASFRNPAGLWIKTYKAMHEEVVVEIRK